jgi:hypothetical protein
MLRWYRLLAAPTFIVSLCLFAVFVTACSDDHAHDTDPADPIEEAVEHGCKHFANGPAKAFTLAKDAAAKPTDLTLEHHRLDVTFVAVAGGNGGFGSWKIAAAGDYVLALSDDIAVKVTGAGDVAVTAEKSLSKPNACPAAADAHVYELGVGTYTFSFGPSTATGVKLVLQAATGAHDEH